MTSRWGDNFAVVPCDSQIFFMIHDESQRLDFKRQRFVNIEFRLELDLLTHLSAN